MAGIGQAQRALTGLRPRCTASVQAWQLYSSSAQTPEELQRARELRYNSFRTLLSRSQQGGDGAEGRGARRPRAAGKDGMRNGGTLKREPAAERRARNSRRGYASSAHAAELQEDFDLLGVGTSASVVERPSTSKSQHSGAFPKRHPGDLVCYRTGLLNKTFIMTGVHPVTGRVMGVGANNGTERHSTNGGDITYVIPKVTSRRAAASLHVERVYEEGEEPEELSPAEEAERIKAVRPVANICRQLDVQIEEATRQLLALGAGHLYAIASAARGGEVPATLSVSDALLLLNWAPANPSPHWRDIATIALLRLMLDDPLHFVNITRTSDFVVTPQADIASYLQVRDWARQDSPALRGFVDRALRSRKSLFEKGFEGPSEVKWTTEDQEIISVLDLSTRAQRVNQDAPFAALASSIVNRMQLAIEAEGGQLLTETVLRRAAVVAAPDAEGILAPHQLPPTDSTSTRELLAEIGIVKPWENWAVREVARAVRLAGAPPVTSEKERLPVVDGLEDVRHDFGDMPAFAVDDSSANEIDDAVSVTPGDVDAATGATTYWVHVHVADPTSVLARDSPLAAFAAQRGQSLYLPEGHLPMLPQAFIDNNALSLGSTSSSERGQRTLTFSARVTQDGKVVESTVRPAYVRRIVRVTYEAINDGFGRPRQAQKPLIAGAWSEGAPKAPLAPAILQQAQEALSLLRSLATGLMRQRVKSTALSWFSGDHSLSVRPQETMVWDDQGNQPVLSRTAPSVRLDPGGGQLTEELGAEYVVGEMMILANRVAARYCVEHGIPAPFRSQAAPRCNPEVLQALLDSRQPVTGMVSLSAVLKADMLFEPASETATPGPHWPMGISDEFGYVRATSPLRRYTDLLSHWQIKASMVPSRVRGNNPAVDASSLSTTLLQLESARQRMGNPESNSKLFWLSYLLRNKLHALANGADDPVAADFFENLQVVANRAATPTQYAAYKQTVQLVGLGSTFASMPLTAKEDMLPLGDVAPVRITGITMGPRASISVERR